MSKSTVNIGDEFRAHYADGNCRFVVIRKQGRGAWVCRIPDDEIDYQGVERIFPTREILYAFGRADYLKQARNESAQFYASLKPGSLVHLHHSGGSFIRCQVTPDLQLLPIALVGDWRPFDLPKRLENGEIYYGYHTQCIVDKKIYHPDASQIWEYNKHGQPDPRGLAAVDLSVPGPTPEEVERARQIRHLDAMRKILEEGYEDPDETVKKLEGVIASYLI